MRILLYNGIIVTSSTVLFDHNILIENGIIEDIYPSYTQKYPDAIKYNCKENYIFPGLIDLHCDCLETVIVPRKGVIFDTNYALLQYDKQLISQGITTMYHSISIANSTIVNKKRTLSVEKQLAIGEVIYNAKTSTLIDHKFHSRIELNTIEAYEPIKNMLLNKKIDQLSFMDHSPGQGQYHDLSVYKKEIDKQYGQLDDFYKEKIISVCQNKKKLSETQMLSLIKICNETNIPLAYHDVDNQNILDWMNKNHFSICEFPLSLDICKKAKEYSMFSVVGAPNIILGKSHNNNLSATALIKDNVANIICSDYYSPSLLLSIVTLTKQGISLPDAVNYCSYYPAKAVKLDKKGSIKIGNIADLIIVDLKDNFPTVVAVYINGEMKYEIRN